MLYHHWSVGSTGHTADCPAAAYQAGFTDDADKHPARQHWQVLQQETGGHDQTGGADEQGHEEVADAGQLTQAVLLLVC